ncbi:MAG: hypothetical protein J7499_19455 [Sphingopyxis sp.]|nr:hypothetical protein [Sphingopyxis sp.]
MDLSNPAKLRATITDIVTDIGTSMGMPIAPGAIDALVAPGLSGKHELHNVDPVRLRWALAAVIREVPQTEPPSPVDARAVSHAIARSQCHYLWFC